MNFLFDRGNLRAEKISGDHDEERSILSNNESAIEELMFKIPHIIDG